MIEKNDKIRVADYLAQRVYDLGVEDVFTITGGGAMFLNDGVAKHPYLRAICNHHEQACAMGAVAYAKYSGKCGVVYPTSGCASTNTITGLLDAWQDNVACLFISGQANLAHTTYRSGLALRQIGVQEANIVEIVKSITKYAVMVDDPQSIGYHFDKAVYLATHGRPGPVWLDIPLDIQGSYIDLDSMPRFSPDEIERDYTEEVSPQDIQALAVMFEQAQRPIVLAGNGIRLAGAIARFRNFIERYNLPVVVTYLGIDLLPNDHPLYVGRVGVKGDRAGNFAVQNSDLLLAIGTRLGVPVVGYRKEHFAREAKVAVVDIDANEHKKDTLDIDLYINGDAKNFLKHVELARGAPDSWVEKCIHWRDMWPVYLPEYAVDRDGINLYQFIERLSINNNDDAVVIADAGSAYYVASQGLKIRAQQRYLIPAAQGELGFTIPATIGVSVARGRGEVIGITGDGSFQTNVQELQTIVHHKLPIKLFVLNNQGYLSNRTTQKRYFDGRYIGADEDHGVSLPEIRKIAYAYGIDYFSIDRVKDLDQTIRKVLAFDGAAICEVMCPKWQEIIPTLGSSTTADGRVVARPAEDMYPFLERDVFYQNMIVKPLEE